MGGGGGIEEIGVRLATKLGEKGIKSEINLKKKKKEKITLKQWAQHNIKQLSKKSSV